MNQRQLNTLRMSRGETTHFASAPDLWNGKPILKSAVNVAMALTNRIVQVGLTQQEMTTNGYTLDKDQQLALMGELTEPLIRGLRPLARLTGNNALLTTVDFAPSVLVLGKEEEVVNRCQLINQAADDHEAALADYGVTPAMINGQQVAIDTFKPLAGVRDTVGAKRKAATDSLPDLFEQLSTQFELLDDLVENLVEDADFKATYRQLRTIKDTRALTGERKKKDDASPTPPTK